MKCTWTFSRRLQGAATTPGTKAFNILSKSAEESDAAAPSAVSGAFDAAMGPTPNVQKLLADLDQKTKANAKKAYGDAFADVRSQFSGHELCDGAGWLNSVTLPIGNSYHPTATGQKDGYYPAFTSAAATAGQ